MPRGPEGEKRPADAVGAAVMVAKIATGEIEEPDDGKNEALPSWGGWAARRGRRSSARSAAPRLSGRPLSPAGKSEQKQPITGSVIFSVIFSLIFVRNLCIVGQIIRRLSCSKIKNAAWRWLSPFCGTSTMLGIMHSENTKNILQSLRRNMTTRLRRTAFGRTCGQRWFADLTGAQAVL